MGHIAFYMPDEKRPLDKGNVKLLEIEDNPALPKYDILVAEPKRSSWHRMKYYLPSVKDVIKLVLFSAVTVIGATFISRFMFNDLGSTVRLVSFILFLGY